MPARALKTILRERGAAGLIQTISAAARMTVPRLLMRRRSGASTGAYFDLVTNDSRRFYGDSFHFGYFPNGDETLDDAHHAHTDLVAGLAKLGRDQRVLDIGCGIGAPALRMARAHGCEIVGINISREQIRQGREMIAQEGMVGRVAIEHGDARRLPYPDSSFDAIVCIEVAGDICVSAGDKHALVGEMFRVLRPGGRVGFSDLALRSPPTRQDRRVLRAVFYDDGSQLVTDWPAVFAEHGFVVDHHRCIIEQTFLTWDHVREVYSDDRGGLAERYGAVIARRARLQLERLPGVLRRIGTFPVLGAHKPLPDGAASGPPPH